jgi:hypothetical protein
MRAPHPCAGTMLISATVSARLAQSVARGSHNPKVVSSILAPRTFRGRQFDPGTSHFPRPPGNSLPAVGIEPTTSGSGNRRASIAPRGHWWAKEVVVMLGLEPRTFALSERRSTD